MNNSILRISNRKMRYLTSYYKELILCTKENRSVGSINEWIIDNYYLISEQQKIIKSELVKPNILRIKAKRRNNIYSLIYGILKSKNFQLNSSYLFKQINDFQNDNGICLSYDEIDFIYVTIKIIITNELSDLCKKLDKKLDEKESVDQIFREISNKRYTDIDFDLEKFIKINSSILKNPFYIEELNYKLNELGQLAENSFIKLNELLLNNNMSLKNIIKEQHDEMTCENVLMVNLFNSLRQANKYKMEDFYEQVSCTEKLLINEKVNCYASMYESSKCEYRDKIKSLTKSKKIDEHKYVEDLSNLANADEKHIGFYLFKEPNYNLRAKFYIVSIILLTLLFSAIGSIYMGFLAFFILLVPVCGLIIDFTNQILLKTCKVRSLFKIKLEDSLKEEYSTMVVIPTIVTDKNKVNQMFDNLELYYLSNRTDNLFFTLLGDATSQSKQEVSADLEIIESGINRVKELNNKYGKEIFYFIYRNRMYNEGEGSFLGYERKRGALLHFNSLLLNKLDEKQKKEYFKCHTFNNFNAKIKYVITLDSDTKLVLNTALKLIGTMVHPMNTPVLSEDNTKVIKGYAIMQPRVSIDVEVTNKSEYSQLFAGLGGLDSYATSCFDLYQDVFNEGSFVGKGIYDLEVFYNVLNDTFPENLILSHDLIEGNYLRCGFISDVELFDGYPSKYLNDAIRHHRWTRGDWQIIGWLKKKVKNKMGNLVSNPINSIEKWKIFDNLRRSLKSVFLFLLVIYGFTIGRGNPICYLIIVLIIIAVPIFFYLISQILNRQKYDIFLRYYLNFIRGLSAVLNKSCIVLALLPYESYLFLDAITKSLYRMFVSKKNLLNWITSEDVEATSKNTLTNYVKNLKINYVFSLIIILISYFFEPKNLQYAIFIGIVWSFAPILMFILSKDIKEISVFVNDQMKREIKDVAIKTWKYFDNYLTSKYNYLIPDNYQLNRNNKIDYRTSPTNIGFSLISVISAYELKIISENEAIEKISNIIISVEKLNKWNGHLFNWYNIYEQKEIQPLFISTADSGNFVSSLYVVKGFLEKKGKYNVLLYRIKKLINETNFSKLYNSVNDVFSVGYSVPECLLVPFHYNNFLSETRLASFLAIAKGDIPFKHWFCLDKTLTKYKHYKGVVSWTGTMFEYYMPLIFMKTYKHTLLDETYLFSYYAQREFIKEADPDLPWGITESAYNELDDSQNYKYAAFGVPYLKFQDITSSPIIIAPYGSIMTITKHPLAVYNNINKFKDLDMYGEYGFYESYDNEDKMAVKSYYAHHQGMILASITNYLKDDIIQEYYHSDKEIQSIEILLKEKVQIKPYIDLKIERYKKYNYNKVVQENDIREQIGMRNIPEVGVLSNGFYSTFINDRGIGFSKYKNLQINRYRKISDEHYGMFMYIKNLSNNNIWTNTYYPSEKKPDKYHVVFASDRIKYTREDELITTNTEITVTKDHNAEIRKITIENNSKKDIKLELTSYGEVIMARNEEDIAHRAFNGITISNEVDEETSSLIFKRMSKTKDNTQYYVINRMFTDDDDKSDFEYETSRLDFIGRNNSVVNPHKIVNNEKLSCTIGAPIDPIMSIRKTIDVKADDKKIVYLIVGFGKSKEQVLEIVNTYDDSKSVENAFNTATILNNMRNNYSNLTGHQLRLYNSMLKYIYQIQPVDIKRKKILENNTLSQVHLWKFGISGDLPFILVDIDNIEDSGFIKEVLQAYEFWKSRAIYIDVVIINNEKNGKKELIEKYINNLMYRINNLNYFENSLGNVYVVSDLTEEEHALFKTVAKISFDASIPNSFDEQVYEIDDEYVIKSVEEPIKLLTNLKADVKEDITFFNQYGGFINDGTEYLITENNTPMPWINVLANEKFGTIISNNLGGFTYDRNSREYKITSWSNDAVGDPSSESIFINKCKFTPMLTKHGFGYTLFTSKTKDYDIDMKVFVSKNDSIKIYELNVLNKLSEKCTLELEFVIKAVLGVTEEQTNNNILANFDESKNSLILQNVYNKTFNDKYVFVTSTETINNINIDDVINKSISINLFMNELDSKSVSFMIGSSNNTDGLLEKYKDIKAINKEFDIVVESWKEKLSVIKVNTPDKAFNYLMNGWSLYQTYSSRLYARTGFYQVGGATGFRDQLQDIMGTLYSDSEFSRKQILKHAAHQFVEGDVLHWWHEELSIGSRTRFSDDYLWLVYVTNEYLRITGDYSILNEQVGFIEGDALKKHESEKGVSYHYTELTETLYYHLKLCILKSTESFGSHGLPFMGSGDWNDGMNKVGGKGKGESVWMGFFLYDLLQKMSNIAKKHGDSDEFIHLCNENAINLKAAINMHAWDGSWYLRAFFDDGTPLGSSKNKECQIDLLSQSWSMLTGIVEESKIKPLIKETDKRLVDSKNKIIKLLNPPFEKLETNPGYISDYIPGMRENGGQYTHGSLWYILALIKVGEINKAYEYFSMINPINRSLDKKSIDVYKTEPYAIAADIYSNEQHMGRGGWTWYTGSACWTYKIGIEEILGLKKNGDILTIEPSINSNWNSYEITYKYKSTTYKIFVNNKHNVSSGVKEILFDQKLLKNKLINLVDDQKEHIVIVNMEGSNGKV